MFRLNIIALCRFCTFTRILLRRSRSSDFVPVEIENERGNKPDRQNERTTAPAPGINPKSTGSPRIEAILIPGSSHYCCKAFSIAETTAGSEGKV